MCEACSQTRNASHTKYKQTHTQCCAQPFAGVLYAGGADVSPGVGGASSTTVSVGGAGVTAGGGAVVVVMVGCDFSAEVPIIDAYVGAGRGGAGAPVYVGGGGCWLALATAGFEGTQHFSQSLRRPVFHMIARMTAPAMKIRPPTTPPTMAPTLLPEPDQYHTSRLETERK